MADDCCSQPTMPLVARPAEDEALATLCKALGHPHRVHILRFLLAQDGCVAGEIADQLPIAASTVSRHLSILKDAGLVKGEVDGLRRCYCVDRDVLTGFQALVEAL